jgi:hypothetical protein
MPGSEARQRYGRFLAPMMQKVVEERDLWDSALKARSSVSACRAGRNLARKLMKSAGQRLQALPPSRAAPPTNDKDQYLN